MSSQRGLVLPIAASNPSNPSPDNSPPRSENRSSASSHTGQTTPKRSLNRIDSILEDARTRRVNMKSAEQSLGQDTETNQEIQRLESSADEETSIVRRLSRQSLNGTNNNTMNYLATNQDVQPKNVMSKPSTTSIRKSGRVHSPAEHVNETETDEQESWWARLISNYGSIELENKGSVARDHLALERTFLAWLRTSLAFASIGIAITQLFRLNVSSAAGNGQDPYYRLRQMGKPLGATFLGISIVMLVVGFHRYFESQHWIIRGKFPASRGSIALVTFITFALMATSLAVVLVVEPRAFEKRDVLP